MIQHLFLCDLHLMWGHDTLVFVVQKFPAISKHKLNVTKHVFAWKRACEVCWACTKLSTVVCRASWFLFSVQYLKKHVFGLVKTGSFRTNERLCSTDTCIDTQCEVILKSMRMIKHSTSQYKKVKNSHEICQHSYVKS